MIADETIRMPYETAIILVNWNRWRDTVECLESILRSDRQDFLIIVCDNASNDGSLDHIADWANGRTAAVAASPSLASLSTPPIPKPIEWLRLGPRDSLPSPETGLPRLILIDSGSNLGFAGGNNVGLERALSVPQIQYFWLLNNDTVIETSTLGRLIDTVKADPKAGMCGTVLRFYYAPDRIQALNGAQFNRWTGQSRNIGLGEADNSGFSAEFVSSNSDFVHGASLLVTRKFLETVGLMEDQYFLYYEEIDWALRNRGRFSVLFAADAVVYHKEGGSIGSSSKVGQRSATSEYYLTRSRLKFIRKFFPWLLPVHYLVTVSVIVRRLLRRDPTRAKVILRAALGLPV